MQTRQNIPIYPDPRDTDQAKINRQLIEIIRQLWNKVGAVERSVESAVTDVQTISESLDANDLLNYTTITASYTIGISDDVILCDTSAGAITVTLPVTTLATRRVLYVKLVSGANAVTVSGTIDGGSTLVLSVLNQAVTLYTNGLSWYVI